MASTTITVSNSAELYSALGTCKGGETILLKGGDYGSLTINPYSKTPCNFPSTVTIASADPAHPATFSQATVTDASNLAFDGVTFDYTYKPGNPTWATPFNFTNCNGLTITNSTFDGDVASGTGRSADDGYATAKGLSIQGSSNITIEGNEFYQFHTGLTVGGSSNVAVSGNELYDMRSDGMNFSGMTGVSVESNYIHDFRRSPTSSDHCDMIQFWTTGTSTPSSNIVIRGNTLDIGNGTATQSIFMRNELVDTGQASFQSMAYRNVVIDNNTITNAHQWGINVGETMGLSITQNTVVHADGGNADGADPSVEIPLINVASKSTGVTVTGNVTSGLTGWIGQTDWIIKSNAFVQDQDQFAPGYYSDVFVSTSLQPAADGSHHYVALSGAMIDILNAGSDTIQPQGQGLQVSFHVDETNPSTRVFDASTSTLNGTGLPAGTIYTWNFGDGTTAKGETVSHSYADGGDYKASLTVTLPTGVKAVQSVEVPVEGPEVLSMDATGHFFAYDGGESVAIGAGKTAGAEGLQLGASGVSACVARSNVLDVVGADDMTIAFSLDADKTGSSGELFRLHGSFVVSVLKGGELQVQIMRDGAPTLTCVTKGAGLNTAVNVGHDVVVNLDNGQLQLWVDGKLDGQMAVPGVVGGATGFNSQNLVFGNPWGQANFNGDLSAFEISVGAHDYPPAPQTSVVSSSLLTTSSLSCSLGETTDAVAGQAHDLTALDHVLHGLSGDHGRQVVLDLLRFADARDDLPEASHDRFVEMLHARLDAFAA